MRVLRQFFSRIFASAANGMTDLYVSYWGRGGLIPLPCVSLEMEEGSGD